MSTARRGLAIGLLAAGLWLAGPVQAQWGQRADGGATKPTAGENARRQELTARILSRWSTHIEEVYNTSAEVWASQMAPLFERAALDALQKAADAQTFTRMNDELLNGDAGRQQVETAVAGLTTPAGSNLLGDAAADLVFVPVTPCRILDTRVAGGVIPSDGTRDFDVTAVSSYAAQGGDASNCNGVGAAGSFAAAAINFTVVSPANGGFITAYPLGTARPLAATVNYQVANDVRGNLAVVKLDQGASANEMTIYALTQTHVVGDIVGYFITPQATPLECVETVSSPVTISAGSFGSVSSPNCDAGYTITGGSCSMSTFDGRVVTTRTIVDGSGERHFCAFRSEAASGTINGVAYARCCRVPGR